MALQRALHNSQVRDAAIRGESLAEELKLPQGVLNALALAAPFWVLIAYLIHEAVR